MTGRSLCGAAVFRRGESQRASGAKGARTVLKPARQRDSAAASRARASRVVTSFSSMSVISIMKHSNSASCPAMLEEGPPRHCTERSWGCGSLPAPPPPKVPRPRCLYQANRLRLSPAFQSPPIAAVRVASRLAGEQPPAARMVLAGAGASTSRHQPRPLHGSARNNEQQEAGGWVAGPRRRGALSSLGSLGDTTDTCAHELSEKKTSFLERRRAAAPSCRAGAELQGSPKHA